MHRCTLNTQAFCKANNPCENHICFGSTRLENFRAMASAGWRHVINDKALKPKAKITAKAKITTNKHPRCLFTVFFTHLDFDWISAMCRKLPTGNKTKTQNTRLLCSINQTAMSLSKETVQDWLNWQTITVNKHPRCFGAIVMDRRHWLWSAVKGSDPCSRPSNFFTFNREIHSYNTRTKDNLHLCHSSTTSGLRSDRHKAAVLWNDLPSSLQRVESLSVFKNHLRSHLLSSIWVFFMYIVILLQGINGLE